MRLSLMLATFLLPLAAHAFNPNGLSFSHIDWELACDNTGTCRAAGYYPGEGGDLAVSILLTREAGPQAPVSAQVMLGEYGENPVLAALPSKFKLTLKVNGKAFGQVAIDKASLVADLSPEQVNALLLSLPRHANIEFAGKRDTWVVSDVGAAAVLLKMDEYQGRVGTAGAIVRKGSMPEASVPAAAPAPTITRAAYAKAQPGDERFIESNKKALLDVLRATIKDQYCDELTTDGAPEPELKAQRLTGTQMLVSTRCWLGAYNFGEGYWVVNDKQPFNPVLVSTSISEGGTEELSVSQKGRGLGDCWTTRSYTWDGKQLGDLGIHKWHVPADGKRRRVVPSHRGNECALNWSLYSKAKAVFFCMMALHHPTKPKVDTMSLQEQFDQAMADSKNLPERPDNMTLLKIYALFKQGSAGDATGERPGMTDFVNRAKFDAWAALAGTSQDDAKQQYIDLIESLK